MWKENSNSRLRFIFQEVLWAVEELGRDAAEDVDDRRVLAGWGKSHQHVQPHWDELAGTETQSQKHQAHTNAPNPHWLQASDSQGSKALNRLLSFIWLIHSLTEWKYWSFTWLVGQLTDLFLIRCWFFDGMNFDKLTDLLTVILWINEGPIWKLIQPFTPCNVVYNQNLLPAWPWWILLTLYSNNMTLVDFIYPVFPQHDIGGFYLPSIPTWLWWIVSNPVFQQHDFGGFYLPCISTTWHWWISFSMYVNNMTLENFRQLCIFTTWLWWLYLPCFPQLDLAGFYSLCSQCQLNIALGDSGSAGVPLRAPMTSNKCYQLNWILQHTLAEMH